MPAPSGRLIYVAVEDVRVAIVNDEPALHVYETNDRLDTILEEVVDSLTEGGVDVGIFLPNEHSLNIHQDGKTIADPAVSTPGVGDFIEVFGNLDDQHYAGVVLSAAKNGKLVVTKDDRKSETLDFNNERGHLSDSVHTNLATIPKLTV